MKMIDLSKTHRWSLEKFAVLDIEGTGFKQSIGVDVVEIGSFKIQNGLIDDDYFYSLVRPSFGILPEATRIHGLTDDDVANAQDLSFVGKALMEFVDDRLLVGHNIGVDVGVLRKRDVNFNSRFLFDTMRLSKYVWGDAVSHALKDVVCRLNLDVDGRFKIDGNRLRLHGAFFDSLLTAQSFIKMISMISDEMSLIELIHICGLGVGKIDPKQDSLF